MLSNYLLKLLRNFLYNVIKFLFVMIIAISLTISKNYWIELWKFWLKMFIPFSILRLMEMSWQGDAAVYGTVAHGKFGTTGVIMSIILTEYWEINTDSICYKLCIEWKDSSY